MPPPSRREAYIVHLQVRTLLTTHYGGAIEQSKSLRQGLFPIGGLTIRFFQRIFQDQQLSS